MEKLYILLATARNPEASRNRVEQTSVTEKRPNQRSWAFLMWVILNSHEVNNRK